MNGNIMQLMQLARQTNFNPQQMLMSLMGGNAKSNPMLNNMIQCAQKGDTEGVTQIAQNVFREQGRDFNKEFNDFCQMIQKR